MSRLSKMEEWIRQNQNILFFRLTIDKSKEEILSFLDKHYTQLIVSQECATRPHFHILITYLDSNVKNAQQNLRNLLKNEWQVKGNTEFAITETRKGTLNRLGAYTVKEGNYVSKGFTEEILKGFHAVSYKKYTKKEFQESLNLINEDFLMNANDTNIKEYIKKYVELKVAYNQNLNINTIVNYINLINAKKFGILEVSNAIFQKFNSQCN